MSTNNTFGVLTGPNAVPNRYIDLSFDLTENPFTGDIPTLVNQTAVEVSVQNLVLTNFFERPFHPEIGSNVTAQLFQPLGPMSSNIMIEHVKNVLANFEPRITVNSVTCVENNTFDGVAVTVSYYIQNSSIPFSTTVLLERIR